MKALSGKLLAIIFYILLPWGEIGGIYHSATKHSIGDAFLAFFLPPYSWYRSLEFFWHDDFANVDWEKRLENDVKTCLYFLNISTKDDVNTLQLHEDIENFSTRISKYPVDKKAYLMSASRKYIDYTFSLSSDLRAALTVYSSTDEFLFQITANTMELEEDLINLGFKEVMEIRKATIAIMEQVETQLDGNNKNANDIVLMLDMLDSSFERSKNTLRETYKHIFNEEY